MKKMSLSLALLLVFVLALSACQGTPSSSPADAAATPKPAAATAAPAADDGDGDADPVEPASDLAPYELTYYLYCTRASDQADVVEAAINELIGEKFNATVDFIMIAGGDWNDKALPAVRSGEKIDIFWTPEWMGYMGNISSGVLLPLNDPSAAWGDLLNTYASQTVIDLGDFIPANIVDGFLYGLATNKELCVPGGLMWNETLVEKYNIDISKVTTIDALEAVLEEFKTTDEYAGGMYPLMHVGSFTWIEPYIQGFMSDMPVLSIRIGEKGATDGVPENVWKSDEYKELTAAAKRWYDNGYVHPDNYLKTFTQGDYVNAGNFLVSTDYVLKGGQVKAKELMAASGNSDLRLVEYQTSASVNVTTHAGGSMWGIPITSKDPARAMMFMNEMHQNVELLNLMVWGIEGTHYDTISPGVVKARDMNGWTDAHGGAWTMGNQFKQYIGVNEDPEKYNQMMALTEEAWAHESLGFRPKNRDQYDNLYTAVYNLKETYERSLKCGVNLEDYDTFVNELDAAGLEEFLEVIKGQYAEWKASK